MGKTRGIGWEYVHVCIDDASRLSFTQIHPDEKTVSAVAHLRAAVAWYASVGVTVSRVMTDNGSCYKSHVFRAACAELGLRHIRTKPYTPRTRRRKTLTSRKPSPQTGSLYEGGLPGGLAPHGGQIQTLIAIHGQRKAFDVFRFIVSQSRASRQKFLNTSEICVSETKYCAGSVCAGG